MRLARLVAAMFLLFSFGGLLLPRTARATNCQFVLGFRALHDLIPAIVGDCLVDEHHNPSNGDGLQETTGGLLVWRKADNWTAFTDGYHSWINGPDGLQERLNTQRFPWEADAAGHTPVGSGAPGASSPKPSAALPSQILLTSNRASWDDLWVVNTDGSGAKQLTFDGRNYGAYWSPDKSKILFDRQDDRGSGRRWSIVLMNADGTGRRDIADAPDVDMYSPNWSPDGSRIVYLAQYPWDKAVQVYTLKADGTDRKQLTDIDGSKDDPSWSPDGTRIAFVTDHNATRSFESEIYVVGADGEHLTPITSNGQFNIHPIWSPDSSMITFSSLHWSADNGNQRPDQAWRIWVMNSDGSNSHSIIQGTGYDTERSQNVVAWRGDKLLIDSYDGHWVVKIADDDGSNVTPVVMSNLDDKASDWR